MILILNYDRDEAKKISDILSELNLEHKVSLSESDLIQADKIILPDGLDAIKVIKKLHLMNLFGMLKMLKKPILGINMGMMLCCENIIGMQKIGLGFFPVDTEDCKKYNLESFNPFRTKLTLVKPTKLFTGVDFESEFYFNFHCVVLANEFTTTYFTLNGNKIAASLEFDRIYGILFKPEESGENGKLVIKNFCELI